MIDTRAELLRELEAYYEASFYEDDSHEEFLIYGCKECDEEANDSPALIVHEADCRVARVRDVIARARVEVKRP